MTNPPEAKEEVAEQAVAVSTSDSGENAKLKSKVKTMTGITAALTASTIGLLIGVIVLATKDTTSPAPAPAPASEKSDESYAFEDNPCQGKRPNWPNVQCLVETEEVFATGEQSGANVTKGYNGDRETDVVPITTPYRKNGLCPVNVHWQ